MDLASLKNIFESSRGISLVVVKRVEVTDTFDEIRALCEQLPEQNEIIARFAFPHCSQGNGFFALPRADDFAICLFPDDDTPIIVGYLPSKDDKVPEQVGDGDAVLKAHKKMHVAGADGVFIGKGTVGSDPAEPLVLGDVLKSYFTDIHTRLDAILQAIITGPVGIDTLGGSTVNVHPTLSAAIAAQKALLTTDKSKYVTTASTNIVSQHSFTERGA